MKRSWAEEKESGRHETTGFEEFYTRIVPAAIDPTDEPIAVCGLGCGTGLELVGVFARAPRAQVDVVALSAKMLERLRASHRERAAQIRAVRGSHLTGALPDGAYDYILAVNTIHHLLPSRRAGLYRRIRRALKPGGKYIEADWFVDSASEATYRQSLEERAAAMGVAAEEVAGVYHIDVPASVETAVSLMRESGFSEVDVEWRECENAVIVAQVCADAP
ncbi:MAG: class I SAM-dependent methyltransferase [Firmicutes bacterium]|jgi:tRNA (cmo5U34)-methyltransferase|nr:class I SAM-dependent methyltransferase [Bacillota bacterium]